MALFKEIISENGIVSKYHRISSVSLHDNHLLYQVASYANKEYRDKNQNPVDYKSYAFECNVEEEESMGIRKLCYTKLKELEEWKDAEDC